MFLFLYKKQKTKEANDKIIPYRCVILEMMRFSVPYLTFIDVVSVFICTCLFGQSRSDACYLIQFVLYCIDILACFFRSLSNVLLDMCHQTTLSTLLRHLTLYLRHLLEKLTTTSNR